MIDFETWWNSSSADEFRRLNDDMDGRVVRPVWDAAIRATLSSQKATSAAPSPEATQPTQAEAPSEREAREMQEVADKLREAGYHNAANNTERTIADIKSGNMPRAVIGAALATQQAVQGEPQISVEHGPWLPSAYKEEEGETYCQRCLLRSKFIGQRKCEPHIVYTATPSAPGQVEPLGYMNAGHVHELQQRRISYAYIYPKQETGASVAVYTATPSAPGQVEPTDADALVFHRATSDGSIGTDDVEDIKAGLRAVFQAREFAPGQVERDREDAENWRYIRRKLCLTGNGDGTCTMQAVNLPAAIQGWPESGQVAEFCDAAIRAARSSEGGE